MSVRRVVGITTLAVISCLLIGAGVREVANLHITILEGDGAINYEIARAHFEADRDPGQVQPAAYKPGRK